jgi:biuret amidohydrolase
VAIVPADRELIVPEDREMGGRRALLLLDLQEAICREDGEIGSAGFGAEVTRTGLLPRAARALARARDRDMFVAYSRLAFDSSYTTLTSRAPRLAGIREAGIAQADSAGAAICSEIQPLPGELVVDKCGIDPLIGTPMIASLLSRGITEIALGGVATSHVVESAARHAADLGFEVAVLADLCAAQEKSLHEHAILHTLPFYATVASSEEYLGHG